MPDTEVVEAETAIERAHAVGMRYAVFVEEQGIPPEFATDEHEHDCVHFTAYDGGEPIGAARLRPVDETTARVEKVVVLAERRNEGWGSRLLEAAERAARESGFDALELDAQADATAFYEGFGYDVVEGEETTNPAGVVLVWMRKSLD